ncbi:MAG: phospholipase D-like domain-containing protein [Oribacterium sp.]|nr:phospholipase D-like domain-containing protein [Oribacterium sp.]
MLEKFDFNNGKFICGKGINTYQKVVDDFNNATEIYIVTFNISKYRDGKLIKELEAACENGTNVTIVTNIPKRFSSYYKDCYALSAHYVIQDYLGILNAEKFNMHLSAFFNFSNHSKIIMTNNVVYCGSANYSDESSNNIECGFISEDPELIRQVKECVISEIIEDSIPYYNYNIAESIASINEANKYCDEVRTQIFEAAYTYWNDYETNFKDKVIYRAEDSGISSQLLSEIIEGYEKYEEAMSVVGDVIDSCYEKYEDELPEAAQKLEDLFTQYKYDYEDMLSNMKGLFEDLDQLAHYDWEAEVMRTVNEDYGMESFDENLEHYVELAMDEANYDYSTLIEMAEPTVKEIIESLDGMKNYYKKMSESLYAVIKTNRVIDNTGY